MPSLQRVLACFGNGYQGRLGLGAECKSQGLPRIVGSLVGYAIKAVSCGGAHTAAITDDGTLFTFGLNDKGQLGHSEGDKFVPVPIEVGLPEPVTAVAAGERHTLCLTKSGDVWAFGSHESGQLGIGPPSAANKWKEPAPRLIKTLQGAGVVALAAGSEHSLALTASGEVYAWGTGTHGQLGMGKGRNGDVQFRPLRIRHGLDGLAVTSIDAKYFTSCAVDSDGRAHTWGHGLYWQLAHDTRTDEQVPRKVAALPRMSSMSIGHMHGLGTGNDGRVYVWGTDDHGTLGQGEGNWQKFPMVVPQELKSMPYCKSVAAGWKHSAAVTRDGRLFTWGWGGAYHEADFMLRDNGSGQLGHGDEYDKWAPVQVQRLMTSATRFYDLRMSYVKPWTVAQVSCGRQHTAAIIEVDLDLRDVA